MPGEIEILMQGDACVLEVEILYSDSHPVPAEDVKDIEIIIGSIRKTYANAGTYFEDGVWKIPLSQRETFRFPPSKIKVQARVALPSGDVQGIRLGEIRILESQSKEEL